MAGPETWAEREQVADIDYENSDTYSGRYPSTDQAVELTSVAVSESSCSGDSDDADDASLSAESPSIDASWESFVLKKRDDGNYVVYECKWTDQDNQCCGYTAKRQLVKRHVEDKHLRIKYVKSMPFRQLRLTSLQAL